MTLTALRHEYRPLGAARTLFECRDPEILLSGPAGTGKTRAGLEKLNLLMLATPGSKGLIVRKTASSLTSTSLATFRKFVIAEALETGLVEYYGGSAQEPAQYRYTNGSTVTVGGLDKASRIMSSEYDVIYVGEATELTEADWEALTTRLRNWQISFQQLIADCNPSHPTHWLKQRAESGKTLLLHSRHEDNPTLFQDGAQTVSGAAYMAKLDALTGVRYLRLRKGLWAAAEGVIFEDYDPAVHLVDRFEIPQDWTRLWSVDFGFTNPFVLQCWAQDPDGRLYRYREIYRTRRTVDQHAADIRAIVCPEGTWLEPRPRSVFADHDAEGRAVFERELGIRTTAAHKKVTGGIQAVQKRLKRKRLFLLRDSLVSRDQELVDAKKPTCTEDEIPGYIWADGKEAPVKEDDHGSDCLRYLVAGVDLRSRPNIRWIG